MFELILQTSVNAVYAASFMALVAVGLVMIFGVMGVINFAHGELYMLGAYCVVFFYADQQFPILGAVCIGLVFVGATGILMERALFRPLRDNPLGAEQETDRGDEAAQRVVAQGPEERPLHQNAGDADEDQADANGG